MEYLYIYIHMHTHPTNYLHFSSQHRLFYAFDQTFDFKTRMDHQKIPMRIIILRLFQVIKTTESRIREPKGDV